jgi:(p)ppGpp synthase/HD superfamily hydrolase
MAHPLGDRFDDALTYAARLHRAQTRKQSGIPYVSHLLSVAALVLEDGGDEDETIAALLHDAVEDQGGAARLAEIRDRYGERVAAIVAGCSDTDQQPKPPWRQRKEAYLRHLADPATPESVLRVSAADKLHNARSVLSDRHEVGEVVWDRFNAGRDEQLWYYRSLVEILRNRFPGRMTDELADVVQRLGQSQ